MGIYNCIHHTFGNVEANCVFLASSFHVSEVCPSCFDITCNANDNYSKQFMKMHCFISICSTDTLIKFLLCCNVGNNNNHHHNNNNHNFIKTWLAIL